MTRANTKRGAIMATNKTAKQEKDAALSAHIETTKKPVQAGITIKAPNIQTIELCGMNSLNPNPAM